MRVHALQLGLSPALCHPSSQCLPPRRSQPARRGGGRLLVQGNLFYSATAAATAAAAAAAAADAAAADAADANANADAVSKLSANSCRAQRWWLGSLRLCHQGVTKTWKLRKKTEDQAIDHPPPPPVEWESYDMSPSTVPAGLKQWPKQHLHVWNNDLHLQVWNNEQDLKVWNNEQDLQVWNNDQSSTCTSEKMIYTYRSETMSRT